MNRAEYLGHTALCAAVGTFPLTRAWLAGHRGYAEQAAMLLSGQSLESPAEAREVLAWGCAVMALEVEQ